MMRAKTRKQRVLGILRGGGNFAVIAEAIETLPVAAQDEARKKALVRELKALDRQDQIEYQRNRRVRHALADKLDKLAIEKKLVK